MDPFTRLPNTRRYPVGTEWQVLKRIPSAMLGITLCLGAVVLAIRFDWLGLTEKNAVMAQYAAFGLWLSAIMMAVTVAFFCAIVIIMKGPAYVWDAYPLPGEEGKSRNTPRQD